VLKSNRMKTLKLLFLIPVILTACGDKDKGSEEPKKSYEELANDAIVAHYKGVEVIDVRKVEEVTVEALQSEIDGLKEAIAGFKDAINSYTMAIESFEASRESLSKVDTKKFSEFSGLTDKVDFDAEIEEINASMAEAKAGLESAERLVNQYEQALKAAGGKSPFTVFSANVDGLKKLLAVSSTGSAAKVLFEIEGL
jgi:exonuclease VII small subunit